MRTSETSAPRPVARPALRTSWKLKEESELRGRVGGVLFAGRDLAVLMIEARSVSVVETVASFILSLGKGLPGRVEDLDWQAQQLSEQWTIGTTDALLEFIFILLGDADE